MLSILLLRKGSLAIDALSVFSLCFFMLFCVLCSEGETNRARGCGLFGSGFGHNTSDVHFLSKALFVCCFVN